MTEKTRKQLRTRKKRARDFIRNYLEENPCIDCGEEDYIVLEFDHRNPSEKKSGVSRLVARAACLSTIVKEIVKCDVRCANCHRRKTAKQFNWWRD